VPKAETIVLADYSQVAVGTPSPKVGNGRNSVVDPLDFAAPLTNGRFSYCDATDGFN
jgi:hypothetical protein